MNKVTGIIGGVGLLIGIFLFLNRGKESVSIINSLAANSIQGIKTLQGR